ncbi:MAG: acyltransferase family protein, partial [Methanoregula sp.]|nr:acyltransferase family protein [Methanoregula sp.]
LSRGDNAPQKTRFTQIDILKGLAIISVVLIHTYNNTLLLSIGAPFTIWQAVPVFLLLAAFNNAYALSSAHKVTLLQSFDLTIIYRRLKRLAGPYLIVWIFQLLVVLLFLAFQMPFSFQDPNYFFYNGINWFFNLLSGASGPGHYFVPVIFQLILFVPLLYYLARRSPNLMLVVAFVLDLALESVSVLSGMPTWLYGILFIRFIFICGLGVWLVFQERVMTGWILFGGLLSVVYIAATSYLNFQIWIFSLDPSFFHAFSFFWPLVIVVLGFQYLPSDSRNPVVRILAELGKASWHIFLVQMTFFFLFSQMTRSIPMIVAIGPIIFLAVFFLVPCLSIGYGFYRIQEYLIKPKKSSIR